MCLTWRTNDKKRCNSHLEILKELSMQTGPQGPGVYQVETTRQQEEFITRGTVPQGCGRAVSLGKRHPILKDAAEKNCAVLDQTRLSREQTRLRVSSTVKSRIPYLISQ